MKITIQKLLIVFFFITTIGQYTNAASLDGRTTPVYKTNHYVFRDQDTIQGFVDLAKGFTIIPATNHGSNIFMDTSVSVSGGIDLRGTSTLTLLRNLYLDEGVTFSDSGRIYSYGNALIINGDLTIPANKVLHCGGNLVVDGNGNTLHLGSGAQLFLDNYATVTLRNMVIETTHSFPGQPALTLSSTLSKLTFDNVHLSLGDDLYINSGQLFFHNDVVVTGTSALVYRSIAPSYIASHGCLMFDHGTTFSYAPTINNKDLLVLNDASSTLALNGSSLLATHTGLRLTAGRLYLDDHVELNSSAINKLSTVSTLTWLNYGSRLYAAAWTPDGRYLAIGGTVPNGAIELQLYKFYADSLTLTDSKDYGTSGSTYILSLAWSPDGRYLAVAGLNPGNGCGGFSDTNELRIYKFDNGTLTATTSQDYGSAIYSVAWSPDCRYIAIVGEAASKFGGIANTNEFQIYRFDGSTLTTVDSKAYGASDHTRYGLSVSWSPDSKYLAIAGCDYKDATETDEIWIYRLQGNTLYAVTSKGYGTSISCVVNAAVWSPDGRYLAVGGGLPVSGVGGFNDTNELRMYSFDGSSLTPVTSQDYGSSIKSISWSPDGRYIAIAGQGPTNPSGGFSDTNEVRIYRFDGSWLTPITSQDYGNTINKIVWNPDGQHIAIGGYLPTGGNELWVDRCNFINETASQPIERGIVFGNSTIGATYNLDVHVLASARVEINGNVFDDPA